MLVNNKCTDNSLPIPTPENVKIRYADNSSGFNASSTPLSTSKYISFSTNNELTWSTWKLFVGADGADGADGNDGPSGSGIVIKGSDTVANILAITGASVGDLWIATDAVGDDYGDPVAIGDGLFFDGINWNNIGPIKGEKGDASWTWIKYSDYADGTSLYDNPVSTTKYIGITSNKTTSTESTDKADYTWNQIKGDNGIDGIGIVSVIKTSTVGLTDTYTITYSDSSTSTFDIVNGAVGPAGATGATGPQGPAGDDGDNGKQGPTLLSAYAELNKIVNCNDSGTNIKISNYCQNNSGGINIINFSHEKSSYNSSCNEASNSIKTDVANNEITCLTNTTVSVNINIIIEANVSAESNPFLIYGIIDNTGNILSDSITKMPLNTANSIIPYMLSSNFIIDILANKKYKLFVFGNWGANSDIIQLDFWLYTVRLVFKEILHSCKQIN